MSRFWITIILVVLSGLIMAAMVFRDAGSGPADRSAAGSGQAAAPAVPAVAQVPEKAATAPVEAPVSPEVRPAPEVSGGAAYRVIKNSQPEEKPIAIGSSVVNNPGKFRLEAEFTPWGGGLRTLKLVPGHAGSRESDAPYVLQELRSQWKKLDHAADEYFRFPLAAESIWVNGLRLQLANQLWQSVPQETTDRQVVYGIDISGAEGKPVLRLRRQFSLEPDRFDLHLEQTFENLSDQPLSLRFSQFSQSDLEVEGGYMGDKRHVMFGYLQPLGSGELTKVPVLGDYRFTHDGMVKLDRQQIWPDAENQEYKLSWVAMDNRYFVVAAYAGPGPDGQYAARIEPPLAAVRRYMWNEMDSHGKPHKRLVLGLESQAMELEAKPGASARWSMTVFAGPKDPMTLKTEKSVYTKLGLGETIYYNLGGMCTICTFSGLTNFLLWFLRSIHDYLTFDWGVAIIILVAVVRLILHPVTKSSQVNMMKATKQMALLQPEVEKLKKKYSGDDQKFQQEQLKLWREKGINPAVMGLGCLPMFLQMPIWIALYAMLFFAIELRHSPAFWGVFQNLGGWTFLSDLSEPDNLYLFPKALNLWFFELKGINLLPVLLGFVFYLQQKLSPTPPPQNEQAAQQQKMMKFMLLLFPIFLYAAPCGLNLYILASTTVGIIESKRVRKHLDELEKQGKLFEKKPAKPGGFMDRLMKAAEQRMQQEQQTSGKKNRR